MQTLQLPSVGALLRESRSIASAHWRTLAAIVLLVYVPIALLVEAHPSARGEELRDLAKYLRLYHSLSTLIGVFATMAIAYLVQEARAGRTTSVSAAFSATAHRWGPSIWMHSLQGILLLLGLVALLAPAVYLGCATYFAIFFVALRDASGVQALKLSYRMVRGRWWPTFGRLAALLGIQLLAIGVLAIPFFFTPDGYLFGVLDSLIGELVSAFFAVAASVLFLSMEQAPLVSMASAAPPALHPA
ncbi:MAG: hypothetical protein DYH12_36060 [Sorangiineae bacterium PRO1]|nr:hypothetical protein [Sorangiineae bacterium PRO1]